MARVIIVLSDLYDPRALPALKLLEQSIVLLEQHYVAGDGNGSVDLKAVAETWVGRTR